MVAVPISRPGQSPQMRYPESEGGHVPTPVALPSPAPKGKSAEWTDYLVAGTLVAGGVLMIAGQRRAGLAVAATGTAIALLEEQEAVKEWWNNLPGYLDEAQHFLDRVEDYLKEATLQGQRLRSVLRR